MLKNISNFTLILFLTFSIMSCGSDGPDCNDETALSQFLSESTSDYFTALQEFGVDPSDSNCKTLLDATNDFIDSIESISDCVPNEDRAEFNELIAEAKVDLNDLDCN